MGRGRLLTWLLAAPLLAVATPVAEATMVAVDGVATVTVVLADGASEPERTAANQLVTYLERITDARFEVLPESRHPAGEPAIYVGPTVAARRAVGSTDRLGPEEWVLRTWEGSLVLVGGRPRGTLYAVYELLERHLGVRWWTPYDDHVPLRRDLELPVLDERGEPAFAYRDISLGDVPRAFASRNKLNGHFGKALPSFGGSRSFGPPSQVHTFYLYVPPEEFFEEHPDYFSEVGGMRFGGEAQLCLTHPELPALVASRMARQIESGRRAAVESGAPVPEFYSFSQNDWGRPCSCERCRAVVEREGSESGPIIAFVDELARRLEDEGYQVRLSTLAYHYSLDPPRTLRAAPQVVVRVTGLHQRDFTLPSRAPSNHRYADAVRGWRDHTDHLWIWDYAVPFGLFGDFPIPNLRAMAQDYAWYVDCGVEGVYLQAAYPISADMRDLKVWVAAKLLSDPAQDYDALVREFTDGYYGPAGAAIRRYLRAVERAARRRPSAIGYEPDPEDYGYLDRRFFREAHRRFDRAERQVAGDEVLTRRVRHARLSLDRATLVFWPVASDAVGDDFSRVADRYRRTWAEQLELRQPTLEREAALAEVDREVRKWAAEHAD